ncbi:MAG: hypothetical protein ACTSWN_00205 [Promethearchaeota archaeon]
MQLCLDNANWAKDELVGRGLVDVPLFCTLQPVNKEMAMKWFEQAIENGHSHLAFGVSEFLRSPKYRARGIQRIIDIMSTIHELSRNNKLFFHLSGLMSFNLLPLMAILGATSTDGSTPVQSALAYGTIFTPEGKGMQVNKASSQLSKISWNCSCSFCQDKTKKDIFKSFNDRSIRVDHNLLVWESLVNRINNEILKDPFNWFEQNKRKISKPYQKIWDRVLSIIEIN